MKMKNGIILGIITLLIMGIISTCSPTYAATDRLYLGIKMLRRSGYGYQAIEKNIWKIASYNSTSGNVANEDMTIYCLKGGPGFGSSDFGGNGKPVIREYSKSFNMKNPSSIPSPYINALPQVGSTNYKALMWILDNAYVAPKQNPTTEESTMARNIRSALLKSAGINNSKLTDDDIDAVQQLAVWYFTNNDGYHTESIELYTNRTRGNDSNYAPLEEVFLNNREGEDRQIQAQTLFRYLINTAKKNAPNYTISTTVKAPIELVKTKADIETVGSKYIVGPYRFNEVVDINYSFEMSFEDQSGVAINPTGVKLKQNGQYVNANIQNIRELAGKEFYIEMNPRSNMQSVKMKVSGTYYTSNITYWSVTGAAQTEQPVAVVEKQKHTFTDSIVVSVIEEKEYDFALRKFITSINGKAPTQSREPVISATTLNQLKNGSITTAQKQHPKNPLTVETGDKVIYTIRVYNEGEADGYVKQITDHLPDGLKLAQNSTINNNNGWTNPSGDGKTIVTTKLEGTLLKAFDGTTLSKADVQVECEVIAQTKQTNQTLKNIAEITKHSDKDGNTVTDRDSVPNSLTQSQLNNYGTTSKQDDDDFEDLILPGKYFDLSLRKFIAQINEKELKNADGRYTREPQVDVKALISGSATTATYNHPKVPISVAPGDEVIYILRIYNEGEIDGYAEEITDHLPPQLEFLPNDELNKQYGWQTKASDTSGRTITTNYLSRAKNQTGNLIKAFDGSNLSYVELKIKCRVKNETQPGEKITNIADITNFADKNGNQITDRDSQKENVVLPTDSTLPNYKDTEINRGDKYIPGQQDDDDFEKLIVKPFDLSLRKFITSINGVPPTVSREPIISNQTIQDLANGSITTAEKQHPKNPLTVKTGYKVIYKIRVYNEGEIDGYAKEITDYLPEGLKLVEDSKINQDNGWTNPSGDGKTIVTTKLKDTLLKAFDGTTLSSADLEVECEVTAEAKTQEQTLKNIAEITKHSDKNGNTNIVDRDSTPDNLTEEQKENYGTTSKEDDDDFEDLVLPAHYFDLSLRKFIAQINQKELKNENGKYTREPQVDISTLANGGTTTAIYNHPKNPVGVSIGDEVIYVLRIYNEGQIDGYANEITDHLPPQLEFIVNDPINQEYRWKIKEGDLSLRTITTDYLSKETDPERNLIKAFDGTTLSYVDLKIKCRVKENVMPEEKITNIAQITDFVDKEGNKVTDRDSQEENVVLPSDNDLPNYKDTEIDRGDKYIPGQQDDDDFEKLIMKQFDLALRKFITKVNDTEIDSRIPQFKIDENGKYVYEHTKDPVLVSTTDIVTYTLRIFNEGNLAGYASEVKDDIPSGLEFLPDNELNKEYRWIMLDEEGNETTESKNAKYITTDYLSKEQGEENERDNLLKPFYPETMESPDYRDVKVSFKVIAPKEYNEVIINKAQISDDEDENGNPVEDKDSTPDEWNEGEDDQDIEKIKLIYFDLALRKFITGVNDVNIDNRVPQFKITEDGEYVYEHTKEPVLVENGNTIFYTLRIFNEGTRAGYASKVKDDIPSGLEFLPNHELNKEYRWVMLDEEGNETTDIKNAKYIETDYLSKEQEDESSRDNLLKPFEPETMESPDYRDVRIAFKVTEPNTSDRIVINKAQISDDQDENGNPVIDKDSTPDKWIEGEDDQDIEKIRVKYFDLALKKWVSKVIIIEDGKETVRDTGHTGDENPEPVVKVELYRKKLNKVVVKFGYKIKVTNEGEIAGYVKEISDYIPQGLKFVAADNPLWQEVEGKVVTDQLKDTLLQPGESATVDILLTWINGEENLDLKVNTAEISKDYNDSNTPDIDSTPNNKKEGEDDIDTAPVILSIVTGSAPRYIALTGGVLFILAAGVALIKKFVI